MPWTMYLTRLFRLNQDRLGGAWCPRQTIQEGVKEWIQVSLGKVFTVTGIVTQVAIIFYV